MLRSMENFKKEIKITKIIIDIKTLNKIIKINFYLLLLQIDHAQGRAGSGRAGQRRAGPI